MDSSRRLLRVGVRHRRIQNKMTSTGAMSTILSVESIEIRVRYEAVLTAKRLKVMGEWIDKGHETQYQGVFTVRGEPLPENVASYRMAETRLGANCKALITDIHSCSADSQNHIPCDFTVTRMDQGREGKRDWVFILKTPLNCFSVCRAITECITVLNVMERTGLVKIFTDSQMAIRAVLAERTTSWTAGARARGNNWE
ncbi:hypothetical protein EVAR_71912_1 [Eumeta japonica]|uniref:RNase H type-1 domain-containing protein n=1 Tax=Eumeta variegata TaxID=151549 RepID=A0A4C1SEU3_EUMVA|nr:hypothetical protein EVAR_71912_1 [Eumeta japonica]